MKDYSFNQFFSLILFILLIYYQFANIRWIWIYFSYHYQNNILVYIVDKYSKPSKSRRLILHRHSNQNPSFLPLKAQYQSLQNSHLLVVHFTILQGKVRQSHENKFNIYFRVIIYGFIIPTGGGLVCAFLWKISKTQNMFIVSKLSTVNQLSVQGLLMVMGKPLSNTWPWHSEILLEIHCLTVN